MTWASDVPERPVSTVVLGKGDLAIRIGEWFINRADFHLLAVIPTKPEPRWCSSFLKWAIARSLSVVPSGKADDVRLVLPTPTRIDLAVSIFYDRVLSSAFIAACDRVLNLHNSLLPKYRGMSPINWALKNGEREHGVTLHEVTHRLDAGPIVAQARFPINPDLEEVEDVYRKCLDVGYNLCVRTLPLLSSAQAIPQDESQATYYSKKDRALLGDRADFRRPRNST